MVKTTPIRRNCYCPGLHLSSWPFSWDGSRLGLESGLAFLRLLLTFSNCMPFFLEDPGNESTFVERIHHWPNNQHGFK